MRYLVTGGAGFLGSHIVDRLVSEGHQVVVYDKCSRWPEYVRESGATLIVGNLFDAYSLCSALTGCDAVFHFSANADVRGGAKNPSIDLEQNTLGTSRLLEAMRETGVRKIIFPSTASVYGRPERFPTPENAPFPVQTSLYSASKLACEGLIEAYCETFGLQAWIFRLSPIVGERYAHGHIYDFCQQLQEHPDFLKVLGDGSQRKSYLYVQDLIDGIILAMEKAIRPVNIFNIGGDSWCTVNDSIHCITKGLSVNPRLEYTGGSQGWAGDGFVFPDTSRLKGLGWQPKVSIADGITKTIEWLKKQDQMPSGILSDNITKGIAGK